MDEIIVAANPPIIGIAVRLTNSIGEIFATPAQARTTPETGENERKIPADNCIGIDEDRVQGHYFIPLSDFHKRACDMIRNSDVTLITDATSAPMAGETFTVTGGFR